MDPAVVLVLGTDCDINEPRRLERSPRWVHRPAPSLMEVRGGPVDYLDDLAQ
ncbi:hypothetical protein M2351_006247 [Azospirillum canadense]|nr:hypothetical protein [Azospirillum canadense]MCW2239270.1 hypothetical protein [Azospirillum canadense]MCW2240964.1 hypothetical protein [Azospirillum canadense]MCW2241602.1 hypothetical protein [Azospirillum canadense]